MEFFLPIAFIAGLSFAMGMTSKSSTTREEAYRPEPNVKTSDYLHEIEYGSFNF